MTTNNAPLSLVSSQQAHLYHRPASGIIKHSSFPTTTTSTTWRTTRCHSRGFLWPSCSPLDQAGLVTGDRRRPTLSPQWRRSKALGPSAVTDKAAYSTTHRAVPTLLHNMLARAHVHDPTATQYMDDSVRKQDNDMLENRMDMKTGTSTTMKEPRRKDAMTVARDDERSSGEAIAAPGRKVFRLMALPAELRNAIYRACLTYPNSILFSERDLSSAGVHWTSQLHPHKKVPVASNIILACRQIHAEANALLYGGNSFLLDLTTAAPFLQRLCQGTRRQFQHMEVELTKPDDAYGPFQHILRLGLRYCSGLKTLLIRMPLKRRLIDESISAEEMHKVTEAFGNLRWLNKSCEVLLQGDVSAEIEAMVRKTVASVKIFTGPIETGAVSPQIEHMSPDPTTSVRTPDERRSGDFLSVADMTAVIDGHLAEMRNHDASSRASMLIVGQVFHVCLSS
nr:hypothetical protein CFP56_37268 [Quercus suber]